jgi:hypothetical protein
MTCSLKKKSIIFICHFQSIFLLFLQEPPIIPVTFVTSQSYAKLRGYEGVKSLNVSFSFRTYEGDGLLLYHRFTSDGYVKVLTVILLAFTLLTELCLTLASFTSP